MQELISRAEARSRGLSEYFTGRPCPNGHVAARIVTSAQCRQCKRDRNNRPSEAVKASRAKRGPGYHLARTYGLTVEDVKAMLEQQGGNCATCVRPLMGKPHVDHCHTSGKVRGLLCGSCNRALGLVRDQVDVLSRMIDYLQAHDPETPTRAASH